MSYSIKIDHEKKYIHYSHDGLIKRKEIGDVWIELSNIKEFSTGKYNLLSDYRNGIFNFSVKDINVIEEFLKSKKEMLEGKKNSVIVDNPADTVIGFLFENNMSKEINFHVKTFSTLNAAISFLS